MINAIIAGQILSFINNVFVVIFLLIKDIYKNKMLRTVRNLSECTFDPDPENLSQYPSRVSSIGEFMQSTLEGKTVWLHRICRPQILADETAGGLWSQQSHKNHKDGVLFSMLKSQLQLLPCPFLIGIKITRCNVFLVHKFPHENIFPVRSMSLEEKISPSTKLQLIYLLAQYIRNLELTLPSEYCKTFINNYLKPDNVWYTTDPPKIYILCAYQGAIPMSVKIHNEDCVPSPDSCPYMYCEDLEKNQNVFVFGCLAYLLLHQCVPFEVTTLREYEEYRKSRKGVLFPFESTSLSESLKKLLDSCVHSEYEKRPRISQVLAALKENETQKE